MIAGFTPYETDLILEGLDLLIESYKSEICLAQFAVCPDEHLIHENREAVKTIELLFDKICK